MGILNEILEYVLLIDNHTVELLAELRNPLLTKLMMSVTGLGSATAALVFLGLFRLAGWRDEFLYSTVALAIAGVTVATLMITVQRPFPPPPFCDSGGADTVPHSFPSGHAAAVTAYAMTARRSEEMPFKVVSALALAVAFSRVYLGTHWLSDTVAGVLIGVVSFLVAERLIELFDAKALVQDYLDW